MNRYAIAFYSEESGMIQKVVEMKSEKDALRTFFDRYVDAYSKDDTGFAYFCDDFYDNGRPAGAVSKI